MISLTCAVTGQWLFINPERILVLESNTIGKDSHPVCRVHVGPGANEYFAVTETANAVWEKIGKNFEHRIRVEAEIKKEVGRYI